MYVRRWVVKKLILCKYWGFLSISITEGYLFTRGWGGTTILAPINTNIPPARFEIDHMKLKIILGLSTGVCIVPRGDFPVFFRNTFVPGIHIFGGRGGANCETCWGDLCGSTGGGYAKDGLMQTFRTKYLTKYLGVPTPSLWNYYLSIHTYIYICLSIYLSIGLPKFIQACMHIYYI